MLKYPEINPVAFNIRTWPVYWYGLMYLVGFFAGWVVLSLRLRFSKRDFNQEQLSDIVFYTAIGAILGGRLGYILFYDTQVLVTDPLLIFQTWKGGMSFHGGLLGAVIALWLCARSMKKHFLALTDFIAPAVPIGLGAGRIGNFINGELWGRATTMPWGMVFPNGGPLIRHPSQLYEFALEGVAMFIILWIYSRKRRTLGAVSGWFAVLYALFRCTVEFFREPDAQIGYLAFGWFTQGQLLSIPLIMIGLALLWWSAKRSRRERIY